MFCKEPLDFMITMPRGDIRHVSFTISDCEDEPVDYEFDDIYFTVKESFSRSSYLFQKKLSAGTITEENGVYWFTIMPEDTNNLKFKTYDFDIEIVSEADEIKQTFVGTLELTKESTHASNE